MVLNKTVERPPSSAPLDAMPPSRAASTSRSESAKKGWITRRLRARQAQSQEPEPALQAKELAKPQSRKKKTDSQPQEEEPSTIQISLSPQYKSRQQQRKRISSGDAAPAVPAAVDDADTDTDSSLLLIQAIARGECESTVVAALGRIAPHKTSSSSADTGKDGTGLEGMIDINIVDKQGTSALIQAVKSRSHTVVKHLLDIPHVDVNLEDNISRSAVIWAVYTADIEMMMLLLSKRSDINVDRALIVAASCGYEDMVNLMLAKSSGVVDINATDHYGNTALLSAIRNNREGTDVEVIVDMLMKHPELDVSIINKYGDSTLIQAVRARNYYLVDVVLSHPSSYAKEGCVDIVSHTDIHGVCAFTWALHCNCMGIAELIAEQKKERRMYASKCTPKAPMTLDYATEAAANYGKTALTEEIVRLLWIRYSEAHAGDDESVGGIEKIAPIAISSAGVPSWNFLECDRIFNKYIINQLLARRDLFVNKLDVNGYSALTWAMHHQYDRIVRVLLGRADVMINRVDNEGQTPLILACRHGFELYVELLLRREDLILNAPDADGKTAIQWAVQNNHESIVACMAQKADLALEAVFKDLIKNNTNNYSMLSILLANMRPESKTGGQFLEKMLLLSLSIQENSENHKRENVNIDQIVSLLQHECDELANSTDDNVSSVQDEDTTEIGTTAVSVPAVSKDTATPRAVLLATIVLFVVLNYGLNAAFEYFTA